MPIRPTLAFAMLAAASFAACNGGSSGSTPAQPGPPGVGPTPAPTAAPTAAPTTSTQQVVTVALPTSAMGSVVDPTFGLVGGYTQQTFSQVLGFVPGQQIMIRNGQTTTPHTFNVFTQSSFPPAGTPISTASSNDLSIDPGFASGNINPSALVGPFVLGAGTFYVGCAYHYSSNTMRTVLVVAANAKPGPQATAPPGGPTPPPPGGIY